MRGVNLKGGVCARPESVRRHLSGGLALAMLGFLLTGCPMPPPEPPPQNNSSTVGVAASGIGVTATEPNETFEQATPVTLDPSGTTHLRGALTAANGIDVFNLGAFTAGDRIIIEVGAQSGGLDADVAIFDAEGKLVYENDDRNTSLGQFDPFINHIIRHDSTYFVGIVASPFAAPGTLEGPYDAIVTITRGGQVPATSGQIVALDVAGGTIVLSGRTFTATPFDTAAIDPRYAGTTAQVLDQIIATVAENYAGLDLDIKVVPRDRAEIPGGCASSTILLGGDNTEAFGISQNIDPYDANKCDNAIVFTEAFTPGVFGRLLTPTELGVAIGNVVAHEVGHLLGLNHVANVNDIMDTTGAANTLLLDQDFHTSPLDGSIFPIGVQDELLLLIQALGLLGP